MVYSIFFQTFHIHLHPVSVGHFEKVMHYVKLERQHGHLLRARFFMEAVDYGQSINRCHSQHVFEHFGGPSISPCAPVQDVHNLVAEISSPFIVVLSLLHTLLVCCNGFVICDA